MATVALKTIRVLGVPLDTNEDEFLSLAGRLSEGATTTFVTRRKTIPQLGASLATQGDTQTGTITLPSDSCKKKANERNNTTWKLDDGFDGLTVLFSPAEPDLE